MTSPLWCCRHNPPSAFPRANLLSAITCDTSGASRTRKTTGEHVSWQDSRNHLKWSEIYTPPHPAPCPPRSLYKGASTPVETGLVWFPTVEMMDWRLTYGKGRGLRVNKCRAALNMKERKKACSTFWLEGRGKGDRNVVYVVCIKTQNECMFRSPTQARSHL